jgi:hypothetical protein
MRESKNGETVGITLRLPKVVLDAYGHIANKKNAHELLEGRRGLFTAQDVMRDRLSSSPEVLAELHQRKG